MVRFLVREVPQRARRSSASHGLTDYSQVDMLGVRYKCVNFGAEKVIHLKQAARVEVNLGGLALFELG